MSPTTLFHRSRSDSSRRRRGNRRLVLETLEGRTLLTAAPTSISVAVSNPAIFYGESETITATISVPAGTVAPSVGLVTIYDGDTPLGSLAPVDGMASINTLAVGMGLGPHAISASYSGYTSLVTEGPSYAPQRRRVHRSSCPPPGSPRSAAWGSTPWVTCSLPMGSMAA